MIALQSCFTGVEGTQPITINPKSADNTYSAEQKLLLQAARQPPAQWYAGKPFMATSGRLNMAFAPASLAARIVPGTTLTFVESVASKTIAGTQVTDLHFRLPSGEIITHRLDISPQRLQSLPTLDIPCLIDLDQVQTLRRLMLNRQVWSTTLQRHTTTGQPIKGRRYEHLTVADVTPGSEELPLNLLLKNDLGEMSTLPASINLNRNSPHRLDLLIALSDPRKLHKNISDKHWELICQGEVTQGMTIEECRLALGQPTEIERTPSYSALLERWIYDNGIYLDFADGLLTHVRR